MGGFLFFAGRALEEELDDHDNYYYHYINDIIMNILLR
jgi:hypothetical protein